MSPKITADFPALRQFMGCYWMEAADLVYGNLTTATRSFLMLESPALARSLLHELKEIKSAGYLIARPSPESDEERFWQQFGARWLTEEDAELVASLLQREQPGR